MEPNVSDIPRSVPTTAEGGETIQNLSVEWVHPCTMRLIMNGTQTHRHSYMFPLFHLLILAGQSTDNLWVYLDDGVERHVYSPFGGRVASSLLHRRHVFQSWQYYDRRRTPNAYPSRRGYDGKPRQRIYGLGM